MRPRVSSLQAAFNKEPNSAIDSASLLSYFTTVGVRPAAGTVLTHIGIGTSLFWAGARRQ